MEIKLNVVKIIFIVHCVLINILIIVRIEFPPVVEMSINRGHYLPQETTNEGPTLINAWLVTIFIFTIYLYVISHLYVTF